MLLEDEGHPGWRTATRVDDGSHGSQDEVHTLEFLHTPLSPSHTLPLLQLHPGPWVILEV